MTFTAHLALRAVYEALWKRSPKWPAVREKHLALNPTCAACGGDDELEVHHIEPFHVNRKNELNPKNLLTLCSAPGRECHFVFGHCHNWSAWNPHVVEDAATHLSRVNNRLGG